MAAHENLSGLQFNFSTKENQWSGDEHEITAVANSGQVGRLVWDANDGEISHLHVGEKMRRRGIATSMWDTAHEEAETRGIIPPKHSSSRTEAGDAWARAVGGHVPGLKDDVDGWSSGR
jgi:ribosomal protein S18 acetylase RimI-like enzyme